ncbi:MAG TPA: leucine--tRNA ligase [Candidatus Saccharimonadales bacterium]|nr:leucine--tRNA ligase [Candidatus Saccharimonadales bacterium]
MKRYNPKDIEPKWQQQWAETKIYEAKDDASKPKKYILEYFPYPSGSAMHVGHVRNYTIGDAMARHARMRGFDVLHPMGWDAFGLPAENYAIKTGISPQQAIVENTTRFKKQLTQMGFGYDWSREFASSDPDYYKWTQWFFLLLFKRGLAYQKDSLQWWCPVDKTVLANEQVENGKCWRCGSEVEKKALKQWFFKITDYADRLAKDLDDVDWSDGIKHMQRNWIGRSEGMEIDFAIDGSNEKLRVFTTAHDTIFGATFMVIAPEHPLLEKIVPNSHRQQVENYQQKSRNKSDIERQEMNREKTGVFTGAYALNPLNQQKIPIWTADYVLATYGTGAIMAVPGEDARDFEFAQKFELPVVYTTEQQEFIDYQTQLKPNRAQYKLANSDDFNGLDFVTGRQKILEKLEQLGAGKAVINYRIRDWLISRQRYWGAPIPIIHCQKDGAVPVPEDQLPVLLPEMDSFEPSGDGRSPLARAPEFVNATCPKCGGQAVRETDTMDGFACSSWYFLRFADPHNSEKAFDPAKIKQWLPVDDYIGGAEHAVMHLLYARMWTKVMQDEGLIDFGEPFKTLRNQGMILAPDGNKMSKSKGNTIEPDGLIEQGYGADAIRIMELFIGPWNQSAAWSVEGMGGSFRFLRRVWELALGAKEQFKDGEQADDTELKRIMHRTIKKVSDDLESMSFNTAIAAMMEAVNDLYKLRHDLPVERASATWRWAIETLLQLLAPFAPHITEEIWQADYGHQDSIHLSAWPTYDAQYLAQSTMTIAVQVSGKLRGEVTVPADASQAQIEQAAKAHEKVAAHLAGKDIKKTIYVPGKLISFVV